MFDPNKLVTPLNAIIAKANERVSKLIIDENNIIVKKIEIGTGNFNTKATVDVVDAEGVVLHADKELNYNRIDIGEFVDAIATESKDIHSNVNKNIVTDYVTKLTVNPSVDEIVSLFNDEYELPIESDDLVSVSKTQVIGRDSSLGRIYKDVNCKVNANAIMYSGGDIVVHQRADTYPFDYNKLVTSRPGFMFYREWSYSDTLEITLPDVETITQAGWEIMFEDIKSTQQLGNGDLWFKIKHDVATSNWIYESVNGTKAQIDSDSLSKIKISTVENVLTVECLSFINNNAYESIVVDDVVTLKENRGLQRITAHTTNPNPSLFTLKTKVSQNEVANDTGLIVNERTYDYVYNQLQASSSSNAAIGLVDKNIAITCYNTLNYVGATASNEFVPTVSSQRGMIQSFDKFNKMEGHEIDFYIDELASRFENKSIVSASVEYIDRDNADNSVRILLKNPKVSELGLVVTVESYGNGKFINAQEANITQSGPAAIGAIYTDNTIQLHLEDLTFESVQVTDNSKEMVRYLSTLTIVPSENTLPPIVGVVKSNTPVDK